MKKKEKKVYLDYAATTPVDPRVLQAMTPYFSEEFGNTTSSHSWGRTAKQALEKSREIIASSINAESNEIIFTSSATESNNLALKGIALAKDKGHIIISSLEHPCIEKSAEWLAKRGFEITKLKVNRQGFINPKDVEKAIKKNTLLVSIIHGSNEIGTIQPIEKIGKICRKKNVLFHTDAAQTFGKVPIDVEKIKIDLLSASSHKIYGPKGAAFLYVKRGVEFEPLLHGGGQEAGKRSSSVNLPAIVGFAEACRIALAEREKERKRIAVLGSKLIREIKKNIPGAHLNGLSSDEFFQKRLPIISFWFAGVEGEAIALHLDLMGVAVSTGSACSSDDLEPNRALLAIGLSRQQAHGSLRISLGRQTKEEEIDYFLKVLPPIIEKLRNIAGQGV